MRHRIVIALLSLGVVVGFGAGFFRLAMWHRYGSRFDRKAAFERHVADVCVDAALRAKKGSD
ncbi:MAG: hypothetical protein KC776_23940 [Myxococcales bacterium]|nr:hypothetical protein [Myxococcales bacterium]MCB9578501.1 hypothetical protein [Polyangiaceae bacterium]